MHLINNIINNSDLYKISSFLLVFLLISSYSFINGPILSSDSFGYVDWAESLINSSFDITEYRTSESITPSFFYILNTYIFSIFIYLSPENWTTYFLFFNCASLGLILLNIYILIDKNNGGLLSYLLALFIFICGDSLLWPSYILLDTFYAALTITLVNLFIFLRLSNKLYLYVVAILIFMLFLKPQSIAVFLSVFLLVILLNIKIFFIYMNNTKITLFGVLIIFATIFTCITSDIFSTYFSSSQLDHVIEMAKKGEVIRDRPETWFKPSNFLDMFFLYLIRFISFFQPWVSSFSVMHNLMYLFLNSAFVISLFIYMFHKDLKICDSLFKDLTIILVLILGGALFHSMTLIDHDWRYKFPYIAPISIFTALIFNEVFCNLKKRLFNYY